MHMQKLIDALSYAEQAGRKPFMANIGGLLDACRQCQDGLVIVDGDRGLGEEDSYRGYYNELAFEPAPAPTPAADVLKRCERALTKTYEGYKGGDYRYDEETPIWCAHYGRCGDAIVSIKQVEGNVHVTTKNMD